MILQLADLEFQPLDNPSLGKVVRAHLDGNAIPWQQADIMDAHFSGDMSENLMTVVESDTKSRTWKRFSHFPVHTNHIFSIGHNFC